MDAVSGPPSRTSPGCGSTKPSAVGARRAAPSSSWPTQLGAAEAGSRRSAIVATELATNLHTRTATAAPCCCGPARRGQPAEVEVVAIDRGPGMADVAPRRPRRQLDRGHARHRPRRDRPAGALGGRSPLVAGAGHGAGRPLRSGPTPSGRHRRRPSTRRASPGRSRGEEVCGDAYATRRTAAGLHADARATARATARWPLARRRPPCARSWTATGPPTRPPTVLGTLHRALSRTRGAAVAVAEIDPDRRGSSASPASATSPAPCCRRAAKRSMVSPRRHRRVRNPTIRDFELRLPAGRGRGAALRRRDRPVDVADVPAASSAAPRCCWSRPRCCATPAIRRDDACVLVAQGRAVTSADAPSCIRLRIAGEHGRVRRPAAGPRGRRGRRARQPGPGPGGHRAERGRPGAGGHRAAGRRSPWACRVGRRPAW